MAVDHGRWSRSAALGVGGAGLLLAAAGVHLDLYLTGYQNIPTIGQLFLVQVASAVMLAVAVAVVAIRRSRSMTAPIAAAGAAFALGTIAAYGVSRATTLFGFHELPTTAGLASGLLEVGAFAALGLLACGGAVRQPRPADVTGSPGEGTEHPRAVSARRRGRFLGVAAMTPILLALVVVAGIGRSTPSSSSPHPVLPASASASASAQVVHVVVSNYAFHPARVLVRPGAEIEVKNEDSVAHTMTALPGSVPFGGFNTGLIEPGATVRIHAPKAAGSYDFYCKIHHFMRGVLVVSGASRSVSSHSR